MISHSARRKKSFCRSSSRESRSMSILETSSARQAQRGNERRKTRTVARQGMKMIPTSLTLARSRPSQASSSSRGHRRSRMRDTTREKMIRRKKRRNKDKTRTSGKVSWKLKKSSRMRLTNKGSMYRTRLF